MHHNTVRKSRRLRNPNSVTWFALKRFKNFASCLKTAVDVSYVFQVSVRMQRALNVNSPIE
jgi:hypothetical protein